MAAANQVIDNFSDNFTNPQIWSSYGPSTQEVNQGVSITSALTAGGGGYATQKTYNLTGVSVFAQLVAAGSLAIPSYEVYPLQVTKDSNNALFWYIQSTSNGGHIVAYKKVAGTTTIVATGPTYDPLQHRFFRIREVGGTVYFDYSANAISWTSLTSLADPFAITAVTLGFSTDTYSTETSTTTATWHNFNVTPKLGLNKWHMYKVYKPVKNVVQNLVWQGDFENDYAYTNISNWQQYWSSLGSPTMVDRYRLDSYVGFQAGQAAFFNGYSSVLYVSSTQTIPVYNLTYPNTLGATFLVNPHSWTDPVVRDIMGSYSTTSGGTSGYYGAGLSMNHTAGYLSALIGTNGSGWIEAKVLLSSISAGPHRLGMNWDGTTLTLYIDGVSVATATGSGNIAWPTYRDFELCFGCGYTPGAIQNGTGFDNFFWGSIDQICVYNTNVSATVFSQNASNGSAQIGAGVTGQSSNIFCYYDFEDLQTGAKFTSDNVNGTQATIFNVTGTRSTAGLNTCIVVKTATAGSSAQGIALNTNMPAVTAGQLYIASAWVKAPAGTTINLKCVPHGGSGSAGTASATATGSWQRIVNRYTAPTGCTNIEVDVTLSNANASVQLFYVDAVMLETGSAILHDYFDKDTPSFAEHRYYGRSNLLSHYGEITDYVFVKTWTDVQNDFSYVSQTNSNGAEVDIVLARTATNFGEGVDVAKRNRVMIYTVHDDAPNGELSYMGYITNWAPNYGTPEQITVTCYSYGSEMSRYYVESGPTSRNILTNMSGGIGDYYTDKNTLSMTQGITTASGQFDITGISLMMGVAYGVAQAVSVIISLYDNQTAAEAGPIFNGGVAPTIEPLAAATFVLNLYPPGWVTATLVAATNGTHTPIGAVNYYIITAVDANGNESVGEAATSITSTSGYGTNLLQWEPVAGAASYNVYRCGSATFSGPCFLANVTSPSYSDSGSNTATAGLPPSANPYWQTVGFTDNAGNAIAVEVAPDTEYWFNITINEVFGAGLNAADFGVSVDNYTGGSLYAQGGYNTIVGYNLCMKLGQSYGATTVVYENVDPSQMLKHILDDLARQGSAITYDDESITMTGEIATYVFQVNTFYDAYQYCIQLPTARWYSYVDQTTNKLHFHPFGYSSAHTFYLGKNFVSAQLLKRTESVINTVYLTGGPNPDGSGNSLYGKYVNQASVDEIGTYAANYTDSNILDQTTLDLVGENLVGKRNDMDLQNTIEVVSRTYPIESVQVGDMAQYRNFTPAPNSSSLDVMKLDVGKLDYDLATPETMMIQVTRLDYNPNTIKATLDSTPPDINTKIQAIDRAITQVQNVNNPNIPLNAPVVVG